jgi:hypothetical protein
VQYRLGAATFTQSNPGTDNATMGVRYQGSFIRTARECDVHGDEVTIKVGVQGRIVLGPAGGAGLVNVPLRYALVREGIEPKTLWTKLFTIPVTIADGQLNVPFVHVEEEMTVPIPSPSELAAYVIYVGFDPQEPETAKPAAKPRGKRAKAN